jgi:hypothetical protein
MDFFDMDAYTSNTVKESMRQNIPSIPENQLGFNMFLTSAFNGGDIVFLRLHEATSTQWKAAMIVPPSEITRSMCNEQIGDAEFLTRLFEDNSFKICHVKDVAEFASTSPHYSQFVASTTNKEFTSLSMEEKGLSRAITYTNTFKLL